MATYPNTTNPSNRDPVVALYEQYTALNAAAVDDGPGDRLFLDVLRRMTETRATTPAGVSCKVRVLVGDLEAGQTKYTDALCDSVVSDLEDLQERADQVRKTVFDDGEPNDPSWWAPSKLVELIGQAREYHTMWDAMKGGRQWEELKSQQQGCAIDLIDALASMAACQPVHSWDDALALMMVLSNIGNELKDHTNMRARQREAHGAAAWYIANALTRFIERETEAERNESAFDWSMPRYMDPYERGTASDA